MLNKLLIILLNYKIKKLVNRKCKSCILSSKCNYCKLLFIKKDIQGVIKNLKEGNI